MSGKRGKKRSPPVRADQAKRLRYSGQYFITHMTDSNVTLLYSYLDQSSDAYSDGKIF